jgi:hypothetical protein
MANYDDTLDSGVLFFMEFYEVQGKLYWKTTNNTTVVRIHKRIHSYNKKNENASKH